MNFSYVIYAVLTMGGVALILGAMLGIASIKFHVEIDPRVLHIIEVLPRSNCGACGFPGCEGAAEAIAKGEASYNTCIAGGHEVAQEVAAILGIEAEEAGVQKVAVVGCGGGSGKVKLRFVYEGIRQCAAANQLIGGPLACNYGCLGFGDCAKACPFDALHMGDDKLPKVDPEKCTACGICVTTCPRGIMKLFPVSSEYVVACNSLDKGNIVRKVCEVGCIGCKICEKACPVDPPAIVVQDNLARFDYETCTNCGICFEKCPTKCIQKVIKAEKMVASSAKIST
jgi:Na+-translocating ferredoxin:NAD+ oxidoreductase RNF subunit RnfB